MKVVLAILAVGLILLGILFVNYKQSATQQLDEAKVKIDTTITELKIVSNEVVVARAETVNIKTQMQAQVDQLQTQVTQITEEKVKLQAQAKEQIQTLSTQLDATKHSLEEEQAKVSEMQKNNEKLNADILAVSQHLSGVQQQLADLEKTHTTTVGHLQAMREDYVKLTNEKALLEAKLHDLNALKQQIHTVKVEMHEAKVEERKRADRAETALGNGGFMMKNGTWTAPHYSGKYPLTEDIRRDQ